MIVDHALGTASILSPLWFWEETEQIRYALTARFWGSNGKPRYEIINGWMEGDFVWI
jgi:hypothetical protein